MQSGFSSPELFLGNPTGFEADRARQARKIDRLLGFFGFEEQLATPEQRTDFVDGLQFEQFEFLLRQMNGAIVNLKPSERTYASELQNIGDRSSAVHPPIDIMPAPPQKGPLLEKVLQTAQTARTLEDKATILAVGINAVHPFPEGNGRVARGVYYLLTQGFKSGDPKLAEVLGEDGENIITPDPNFLRPVIMGMLKIKLGTHIYDPTTYNVKPRLISASNDANFNPVKVPEPFKRPLNDELAMILLQEDMKDMVPLLAAESDPANPALNASIVEHEGQPYFLMNKFWEYATDEDFIRMTTFFTAVKDMYVEILLEQMLLGDQSFPSMVPDENGNLVQMPCAVAMSKITKRELDVSPEAMERALNKFSKQ